MYPLYETTKEEISIVLRESKHIPPHLHNAIEFVYVIEGTLELGVGTELFHMDKGDFAFVFPDIIHHYQVFGRSENKAYYIQAPAKRFGMFENELQRYCPSDPVIKRNNLPFDIVNIIETIAKDETCNLPVKQAYIQVILARLMPKVDLVEKKSMGSNDIVYKTVAYAAANFRENFSLEKMAYDLGISKFVLSRVFSGTFHTSFSQYINEIRLNYACAYLENSNQPITEICMDCGFKSQRTFNRVFKQRYHMTPREYRITSRNYS